MKRSRGNAGKKLDRLLARCANPSPERMESAINRVRERLRLGIDDAPAEDISHSDSIQPFRRFRKAALAAAAAALAGLAVFSLPFVRTFLSPENGYAIVETVDGSLSWIANGNSQVVKSGERIDRGKILRTNGAAGAILALADGSRVEMRSQSELALQTAEDGALLQLNDGSIIVTAAKQRKGHLYVRTRDVTVSVVGTVFLVNAETEGSRVAVIQGEVQVQHGATLKKLLPGEQVVTNPIMQSAPVIEEILWSRNAAAHLALLQQALQVSTALAPQNSAATAQTPSEERLAFEVASI